jgi:hypothetical protein
MQPGLQSCPGCLWPGFEQSFCQCCCEGSCVLDTCATWLRGLCRSAPSELPPRTFLTVSWKYIHANAPARGSGLGCWQWQPPLQAREPLFPGRAPRGTHLAHSVPNPVISYRTSAADRAAWWSWGGVGGSSSGRWASIVFFAFPQVIVRASGLSKSPETQAPETRHCTGSQSALGVRNPPALRKSGSLVTIE